jgi:amino acid permease
MQKGINASDEGATATLIYAEDAQYTAGHRPRTDSVISALPDAPVDDSCQPLPHGSVAASAFNLASATLGAGTLALPQAMATTGDAIGICGLCLGCAATIYSIRLLIIVVERTGYSTYEECAKKLVSPFFEKVVAALIMCFNWGTTLVYVVAIGKVLASFDKVEGFPEVFKGEWGHRFITSIFWCLFMLPLSLAKEINTLRYASLFGMLSTMILVAAIVTHSAQAGKNQLKAAQWSYKMVAALPVFSFSYCCQSNAFEIYAELSNRSTRKMTLTTAVSMITCTCIYIIAGIAGFAEFGDGTDGDILSNYGLPTKSIYIAVAVVAISFTLTMAFPICIFPTRDAVVQMMGYRNIYETPAKTRLLVAGLLATASIILGLFVPDIQLLFGVLGGVFGSSLGYILPVIFAWKSGDWTVEEVGYGDVIGTWALLVGGMICGIGGTVVTLIQTF